MQATRYTISKRWDDNRIDYDFTQPYEPKYDGMTCKIPIMKPNEFEACHYKAHDVWTTLDMAICYGNMELTAHIINNVGTRILNMADEEGRTLLMSALGSTLCFKDDYICSFKGLIWQKEISPFELLLSLNADINCASFGGPSIPRGATPLWFVLETDRYVSKNVSEEYQSFEKIDGLALAIILLRRGAVFNPEPVNGMHLLAEAYSRIMQEGEKALVIWNAPQRATIERCSECHFKNKHCARFPALILTAAHSCNFEIL